MHVRVGHTAFPLLLGGGGETPRPPVGDIRTLGYIYSSGVIFFPHSTLWRIILFPGLPLIFLGGGAPQKITFGIEGCILSSQFFSRARIFMFAGVKMENIHPCSDMK